MLNLYNTASKSLEPFTPTDPNNVKIYTCGPTVYSSPHLGNFAAYIYWDLLLRVLVAENMKVNRVLNLTDVGHLSSDADDGEDKLEKGAKREGKTVWEIADFYIREFKADFKKLNLLEPEKWARATDYIDASKALVEKLIKNGYTYETADGVYFDTAKFSDYGTFAHLDLKNLKAGARVEFSSEKKNPSDFAVWKFIKPGESHAMRWDFLGRPGYPGWHLECSAIIHETLGEPIDLHAGGIDHIPVHHTNEIAQTFGAFEKPLARFWLHCNFLKINGEKISKSLGNIITLDELEKKGFSPFDFKLWLYQGHYRSERNFTFEDLQAARSRRLKWRNRIVLLYQGFSSAERISENSSVVSEVVDETFSKNFRKILLKNLDDDLNSAAAFAYLDSVAELLNLDDWRFIDSLFALDLFPENLTPELRPLIEQRNLARKNKDYAAADKIRDELAKNNITVLDAPSGSFWQFIR